MNNHSLSRWLAVIPASAVSRPPSALRSGDRVLRRPLTQQVKAKVLTPPEASRHYCAATCGVSASTARPPPAAPAPVRRPAPTIPQSPVLDSIREVVFHNLLEKDRAGFSTLASAFCLSLSTDDFKKASTSQDRADPSEAMVRRLADTTHASAPGVDLYLHA